MWTTVASVIAERSAAGLACASSNSEPCGHIARTARASATAYARSGPANTATCWGRAVTAASDALSQAVADGVETLVVVGGDFNATPDKPEMDSMFARGGNGRFVSAHQLEGRAEKTTDNGRQIDYVFFSQNRAASGGLQVIPTGSDHHMLVATTRWG